jgi:hypothetical protein
MLSFKLFLEQYNSDQFFILEELNDSQRKIMNSMIKGIVPSGPKISSHIPGFEKGILSIPYKPEEKEQAPRLHPEVEKHLKEKGFNPISTTHAEKQIETTIPTGPRKGEVVKKVQQQSIGKVLSDNPELQRLHAEHGAKAGAKGGEFKVTIHNGENPEDIFRMSSGNKQTESGKEPWTSCMALPNPESSDPKEKTGGMHHNYLQHDYKQGTHAAYIHRDGRIIGRVALKPFVGPNGHTILRAERHPDGRMKFYGSQDSSGTAEKVLNDFENNNFSMKSSEPFYQKHPDVYDDENLNTGKKKIIYNGNPDSETLHKFLRNKNPETVKGMLKHSSISSKHLDTAMKHSDKSVRHEALSHPNIHPKHLEKTMNSIEDHEGRAAVMTNPNVPGHLLDKGLNDFVSDVRLSAIKNKKVTLDQLQDLKSREKNNNILAVINRRITQKQTAAKLAAMRNNPYNIK